VGGPVVSDVPVSHRDLELMLLDRGVEVDHTTIFRWIQAYAVELEKRIRPHLRMSNGSWRVDETYLKVKGCWMYLYRAVDSRGQTIDFLLSAKRDAEAAKRFFRKALAQPHTVNPLTITVDKNAAYPKATTEMKKDGELWSRSRLRQVKYLNNIVKQDHRRVKRLTGPGLGFGGFWTARRTLAGYEAMAMIRKGKFRTSAAVTSGRRHNSSPDCSGWPPETSLMARRPTRKYATQPNSAISSANCGSWR
jgi:IS6 family transposase